MALLVLAGVLAVFGAVATAMAMRYRHGRARYLERQPYHGSLWPAARRNVAYGLLPIAGICFVIAASMVAQVAGVGGPLVSAASLVLVLALLMTLVVFMVTRPRWLAPDGGATDRATGHAAADEPPRPISEMTPQELADWARDDPDKLRRLMRRRRF
jgi:hypothetical protein